MITLKRSTDADLALAVDAEADPGTRRRLGGTGIAWHRGALTDPDQEHLTFTAGTDAVAYAVLAGLTNPNRSLELRRIVTLPSHRGRGHGRAALTAIAERVFTTHAAHRLWLDVKTDNARARALYRSAGFVEEGELRDALQEPDGTYSTLVVMSLLAAEFADRVSSVRE
jgi:RimJ/RimL family protein N-acetyltransferase